MNSSEPTGERVRRALGIPWRGEFPHPTVVMGIVNVTPDSFQEVGRHRSPMAAIEYGLRLYSEGADILDIGGESSRPGAPTVPVEEELERVIPVIRGLRERTSVPISVDTRKSEVARASIQAGARIVNDISAGQFDAGMFGAVAAAGAYISVMHGPVDTEAMRWSTAETTEEKDITESIRGFLTGRANAALAAGVSTERIWVDPGFGFGKSVFNNLRMLRELDRICSLPWPLLIGTSRKSTLGAVCGGAGPEFRLEATLATIALAIHAGAAIVRVHDVASAVHAVRTADAVVYPPNPYQA